MFQITPLIGFGGHVTSVGLGSDIFYTRNETNFNTDSTSFTLNVGTKVGTKQIVICFAVDDDDVDDAFTVSATLAGNAMTLIHEAGRFVGTSTVGVSMLRIETTATGVVTVAFQISGFTGTMDRVGMRAIVMSGYNPVPIDTDSANSGVSAIATVSVTGARLVVVAGAKLGSAPGNLRGPGSKTTFQTNSRTSVGYAIINQTGNKQYEFDAPVNAIVAASFALA